VPVWARNVVATSQPLAAQAGLAMLQRGGGAVDAAVAAAAALTVVQPNANGIGGDLFAIVWTGDELMGLNASGRAPRAWSPERFRDYPSMPEVGWDAVTVPGAVSGWTALHRRFGRLAFSEVLEPAIRYADAGFHVTPGTARGWSKARDVHGARSDFREAFLPGGYAPTTGELWRFPDQARTLESIARSDGSSFYRGTLARKIANHARSEGAALDEEDLASHEPEWVEPIFQRFGRAEDDLRLWELPPNGQGLAALIALGLLDHTPIHDLDPDGVAATHLQIEAMKLAFADVERYVGDPEALVFGPRALLDPEYLEERARSIDPAGAGSHGHGMPRSTGTVYVCVGDAQGCMVSLIQSNYMGFGSGVVVPGTGISLQNRGAGFTLEPGHPNRVGSRKRPFHTIAPAFVTLDGRPVAAFGVVGGPMQPQAHLQLFLRMAVWGQNPQAACDAPRWKIVSGSRVGLESRFASTVRDGLRFLGHDVVDAAGSFGGAQVAWRLAEEPIGYAAASDPRRDGQAVGF
jgi:gamma-glutamyltranspeptidase/glutathione hydrolase